MTVYHGNVPEDIVVKLAKLLKPESRVLDLACGIGRNAIPLAKAGHFVEGRDNDAHEVRTLRERAEEEGVIIETIVCDVRDLRLRKHDAILAILALHLIPRDDGRQLLKHIATNVLSGGYAAMSTLTSNGDLAKLFERNFYPSANDILTVFDGWEILEHSVGIVPCKTRDIKSGLKNERVILLARKPA
jgi:2-polyprenyl-3-methyl-5-hydroxy-6-metoxy-1,4-benzoquinol methylase